MPRFFARHAATLFFPMALILYDFAAYLSTDLIQPGIINVVRDFNADVSLAPAAVSLYLAGGMALQWLLGPLSDRVGRRPVLITGALIFTLACAATMFTTSMTQFLIARAIQGTSICFIATVGYVTVQEAFGQTKGIKLMAIITSIVLIAPIIGPLSGAALMHFVHWKVLFAIIAVMGFISFVGLLLAMPETVKRGAVPFSAKSVLRDFRNVFCNRLFLFGAATISLSDRTALYLACRTPSTGWPRAVDYRQSAVTARLAVVGAGHQSVCFRDWFDFPDLIPLYAVFQ